MGNETYEVSIVTWQDAAFSFENSLPSRLPEPRIIFGVILHETDDYIFVVTNLYKDKEIETLVPVDGMVIPRGTVIEIKRVSNFHD